MYLLGYILVQFSLGIFNVKLVWDLFQILIQLSTCYLTTCQQIKLLSLSSYRASQAFSAVLRGFDCSSKVFDYT